MAVDRKDDSKRTARRIIFKALKATIKGVIFYAVYFVLWQFMAPLSELIPGLQQTVETFVTVYVVLMVIGELTAGTIYQHFFNAAKSLFVVVFLIFSLEGGMFGMSFEGMRLMVDLRLLLIIAMTLSLLGFAKSVLQAINFLSAKAES